MDKQTEFLKHQKYELNRSPHTVSAYRGDLRQLSEFLVNRLGRPLSGEHSWSEIGLDLLGEYVIAMRLKGVPKTVRRKIACLKSFFGYLADCGDIDVDPTVELRLPRGSQAPSRCPTVKEMARLLEVVNEGTSREDRRAAVLVELLYATGLRSEECASLDIKHVDLDESQIRCMGKGSKERIVFLHPKARAVMEAYLGEVRPAWIVDREEQALFLNESGARLGRVQISYIVATWGRIAGLGKIGSHSMRHAFGSHLLQGGASMVHVSELLGHATLDATAVYAG